MDSSIQQDNSKEFGFVSRQENDIDNLHGLIVENEEQAYCMYVEHARRLGFDVRKGQKRYGQNSILRQFNYLCSKSGFQTDSDNCEDKKIHRLDTRTGCKACIRFTIENDKWKVTHFNGEHNHAFANLGEKQFLKINRKITESHAGVLKTMVGAGIRTTNTYSYLAEEVGGSENVGFTKRDCYNFVNAQKLNMIEAGDAQSLINLFKSKQVEDPMFFYSVQVDHENRMTNFFWRDGKSRCDYDCFGDVVVFDTTYRTNKYNMICAPFVGINHHWSNILFGCAFLLDETTASFTWLFETFLESMGNKQPKCIMTDQCQAMANANKIVFPESTHRLCKWHLSKNAGTNLSQYFGHPDFRKYFNRCLYFFYTEDELELNWKNMLEKFQQYKLHENPWLQKFYSIRGKWCSAFSPDTFTARVQSSQRSESLNNVFHNFSTKTISLTEFVNHYDKMAKQARLTETEEDYRCNQGLPKKVTKNSGLLTQAENLYTRTIFKMFEDEFIASLVVIIDDDKVVVEGDTRIFLLNEEGHDRVQTVVFNSMEELISCSCKLFEQKGILCRHALRVMNVKNVTRIPNQYIMQRWTKDAKKCTVSNGENSVSPMNNELLVTSRRNEMMRMAYGILSKCAESSTNTCIAKSKLREIEDLIKEEVIQTEEINIDDSRDNFILDPSCVRPKGLSNARVKGCLEKSKRKRQVVKAKPKKLKEQKSTNMAQPAHMVQPGSTSTQIRSSPRLDDPSTSFTDMLLNPESDNDWNEMMADATMGRRNSNEGTRQI